MRALVVGCGYIGKPLAVRLAKAGHAVFAIRRSSSPDAELSEAGVQLFSADITNRESLNALPVDI